MSSLGRYSGPPEWSIWLELPRPRFIRMQRKQRFWVAVVVASMVVIPTVLFGILLTEWKAHPPKQTMQSDIWSTVPFVAGALFFLLMLYIVLRRDRRLVTQGEIAIGRIVSVRTGGRRRGRIVTYEFLDRSGRLITASCADNIRSFSEGMAIPVFFNSENPESDQIALCGTPYEVAIER